MVIRNPLGIQGHQPGLPRLPAPLGLSALSISSCVASDPSGAGRPPGFLLHMNFFPFTPVVSTIIDAFIGPLATSWT